MNIKVMKRNGNVSVPQSVADNAVLSRFSDLLAERSRILGQELYVRSDDRRLHYNTHLKQKLRASEKELDVMFRNLLRRNGDSGILWENDAICYALNYDKNKINDEGCDLVLYHNSAIAPRNLFLKDGMTIDRGVYGRLWLKPEPNGNNNHIEALNPEWAGLMLTFWEELRSHRGMVQL